MPIDTAATTLFAPSPNTPATSKTSTMTTAKARDMTIPKSAVFKVPKFILNFIVGLIVDVAILVHFALLVVLAVAVFNGVDDCAGVNVETHIVGLVEADHLH